MVDENYKQIFIKNIPYDVNEDELSQWCQTFGPISKCQLKRDKNGLSRGFAFVKFTTSEGHNKILSNGPHFCKGRSLLVRTSFENTNSNENEINSSPDQPSQTIMDNSIILDDDSNNRLATIRDELDANFECMQIAHAHELKILRDKLEREKKLQKEAEENYREAKEDWQQINEENNRIRTSLIKNVMQTFNIRRDLARRTKDQLKKCVQLEKQCDDMKSKSDK